MNIHCKMSLITCFSTQANQIWNTDGIGIAIVIFITRSYDPYDYTKVLTYYNPIKNKGNRNILSYGVHRTDSHINLAILTYQTIFHAGYYIQVARDTLLISLESLKFNTPKSIIT